MPLVTLVCAERAHPASPAMALLRRRRTDQRVNDGCAEHSQPIGVKVEFYSCGKPKRDKGLRHTVRLPVQVLDGSRSWGNGAKFTTQ